MNKVVDFPQLNFFQNFGFSPLKSQSRSSCFHPRYRFAYNKRKCSAVLSSSPVTKVVDQAEHSLVEENAVCDGGQIAAFPHVQSLRDFPKEELSGKVVMVRFDTMIIHEGMKEHKPFPENAFSTIKYLHESGAKVILVGSWNENTNFWSHTKSCLSAESVADFLSSMLELEVVPVKHVSGHMHVDLEHSKTSGILLVENLFNFKEERANCLKFAEKLASGVDIVVNDAFSESHKVLASTVGVASFCYACIAGFYFEEDLYKLKKIVKTTERPYVAIIGGGNLADKAAAMQLLASTCDGLVFVGSMAFLIMHALGVPVPMKLVEPGALKEAVRIVEFLKSRNIPLGLPQDVWCIKDHTPSKMEIVSIHSIREGWQPVDIGPRSLDEMTYFLSKCKLFRSETGLTS